MFVNGVGRSCQNSCSMDNVTRLYEADNSSIASWSKSCPLNNAFKSLHLNSLSRAVTRTNASVTGSSTPINACNFLPYETVNSVEKFSRNLLNASTIWSRWYRCPKKLNHLFTLFYFSHFKSHTNQWKCYACILILNFYLPSNMINTRRCSLAISSASKKPWSNSAHIAPLFMGLILFIFTFPFIQFLGCS